MARYGQDFDRARGGTRYDRGMRGAPAGYDGGFRASQARGYDRGMRDDNHHGRVDGYRSDGRRHRDDRGRRGADWIHEGGTQPGAGAFYANRAFSLRDSGYASGTFFGGGYAGGDDLRGYPDRGYERGYERGPGRDRR